MPGRATGAKVTASSVLSHSPVSPAAASTMVTQIRAPCAPVAGVQATSVTETALPDAPASTRPRRPPRPATRGPAPCRRGGVVAMQPGRGRGEQVAVVRGIGRPPEDPVAAQAAVRRLPAGRGTGLRLRRVPRVGERVRAHGRDRADRVQDADPAVVALEPEVPAPTRPALAGGQPHLVGRLVGTRQSTWTEPAVSVLEAAA